MTVPGLEVLLPRSIPGFLLGLVALGQGVPERTVPPGAELPDPFTRIEAVRELPDGRVLVLDKGDAVVKLADFAKRTIVQVGRQGGGPGEYRQPGRFLVLPGDTTGVVDAAQGRTLLLDGKGSPAGLLFEGLASTGVPQGAATPLAADDQGRLYFTVGGIVEKNGALLVPDSVRIARYERRNRRLDTVATILTPRRDIKVGRKEGKITSVSISIIPFQAQDDWELLPGSRLAVVRTGDYHTDFIGPGDRIRRGPRVPYEPIPVARAERDSAARFGELPNYKPPFEGSSVTAAPDGHLWIRRLTAYGDSTSRFDVLDGGGRLIARVALPRRTTLAGFGRSSIYLVRRDQDDLEYLGRGPLPRY